ncbi:MAG TPA: glycosyltransferase family 4 protein [Planctomycetota bacterium]|nr:glycosyltransferase family 4 protein [Planctomycetota bacterium]
MMPGGKERLRVLMTVDALGGVWSYATELIAALERHGVEVALATMGRPLSSDLREQARRFENVQLFESSYKLEWMEDPWADVAAAAEWLLKIEKLFSPDVIHLNGFVHGVLPFEAPVLTVGHSCVLSWWRAVFKSEAPATWSQYKKAVAAGLRLSSRVIAPTQTMLDSLASDYGPFENSGVIANARDPRMFAAAAKEPFVFAAGRVWDQAKNIAALDRAAPGLQWPVLIAGEERDPNGARTTLENVQLLGRLSGTAVAERLSRAAIYAHPARYEPFGLAVLEAALSECALVLGNIPSLRENWNGAAVFVPADDSQELRRALRKLIDDEPRRKLLGAQAAERARAFSPEKMAEQYFSAYCQMLSGMASAA